MVSSLLVSSRFDDIYFLTEVVLSFLRCAGSLMFLFLARRIARLGQCGRSKPILAKNKCGRPSTYGLRVGFVKSSTKKFK